MSPTTWRRRSASEEVRRADRTVAGPRPGHDGGHPAAGPHVGRAPAAGWERRSALADPAPGSASWAGAGGRGGEGRDEGTLPDERPGGADRRAAGPVLPGDRDRAGEPA